MRYRIAVRKSQFHMAWIETWDGRVVAASRSLGFMVGWPVSRSLEWAENMNPGGKLYGVQVSESVSDAIEGARRVARYARDIAGGV